MFGFFGHTALTTKMPLLLLQFELSVIDNIQIQINIWQHQGV
jgi:hypothetical protein